MIAVHDDGCHYLYASPLGGAIDDENEEAEDARWTNKSAVWIRYKPRRDRRF